MSSLIFTLLKHFRGYLEAALFLCIAALILGLLGTLHWSLDLLSHFRLQILFALFLGALTAAFLNSRFWSKVSFAVVVLGLLSLWPFYEPQPSVKGNIETLKIVSYNLLSSNNKHGEVVDYLLEEDADVIFLMENNSAWMHSLRGLHQKYPHHLEEAQEDNFGVALYSKKPLSQCAVRFWGVSGAPSIEAVLECSSGEVHFIGTHPVPPSGGQNSFLRNDQLRKIQEHIASHPDARWILVGDINITPFSPHFAQFLKSTGLKDSARGFGYQATWMCSEPWFAIAIDHALLSRTLYVTERKIGPDTGSDHRPLVVRIAAEAVSQ